MRKLPILLSIVALGSGLFSACSSTPPRNTANGCALFDEKDDWYEYARDSYEKWGIPIHVQLAIIYQESRFDDDARPPRRRLLGFIPWLRPSSAYGYGQVKDSTWDWYRRSTGNRWADRDDFDDVTDFIGWYGDQSHRRLGISREDAYNQYLAYHEGHGGWQRGTYRRKPWLLKVARRVEARAARYRAQLKGCEAELRRGHWWWPF